MSGASTLIPGRRCPEFIVLASVLFKANPCADMLVVNEECEWVWAGGSLCRRCAERKREAVHTGFSLGWAYDRPTGCSCCKREIGLLLNLASLLPHLLQPLLPPLVVCSHHLQKKREENSFKTDRGTTAKKNKNNERNIHNIGIILHSSVISRTFLITLDNCAFILLIL